MVARTTSLILAILAILTAQVYLDRRSTLERGQVEAENLATAIAHQTTGLVTALDQSLAGLALEIPPRAPSDPAAVEALRQRLLIRLTTLTQATNLYVTGPDGAVLVATDRTGASRARQELFGKVTGEGTNRLFVGTPERIERSGQSQWSFDVARPIRGPDGAFLGTIGASLDLDQIQNFYNALSLRDGGVLALLRSTGDIVVRAPFSNDLATRNMARSTLFEEYLPRSPDGSGTWRSSTDGAERIFAYRSIHEGRLIVLVGFDKAAILAPWKVRTGITAAMTALLCLAVAIVVGVARREQKGRLLALQRAQSALAENERIFAAMSDAFFALAPDWRIVKANRQATNLLQKSVSELTGCPFWDAFPGSKSAVGKTLEQVLETGEAADWRVRVPELDRWLECRAVRHGGAQAGSVGGLAVFIHDATDLMRYEEHLERTQRLDSIGQLTGGIAHDFNNLLVVILGNADTLSQALADRGQRRAAELIAISARRAAELVQRLLAFARRQPLAPRSVDVEGLLRQFEPLLRQTLAEHIDLNFEFAPGTPPAHVDPVQLETAILNLAGNARDAMPEGGRLSIEVRKASLDEDYVSKEDSVRAGTYVSVTVTDSGTGMTPDTVKRAFEPFYTTKEIGKGTGLGLSMVYGFVKQSRGHVKIYSEPGAGTAVKLYLPVADQPADLLDDAQRAADAMPGGAESIFVVEDDDLVREHICEILRELGYAVRAAADGPAAIEALKESPADLLLTDVTLPRGMNGRVVAEQAAAMYPRIKILYMSGYSQNTIIHQGRLDKNIELIGKPFAKKDLARRVRKLLDGRGTGD
jgi:signal transduction histidine kinase